MVTWPSRPSCNQIFDLHVPPFGKQDHKIYSVGTDRSKKKEFKLGGGIKMTPVYHEQSERVYVGSDADFIHGLDADSFEEKWKSRAEEVYDPRGTPVVATVNRT